MSDDKRPISARLEVRPAMCQLVADRTPTGVLVSVVQRAGGRETGRVAVEIPADAAAWLAREILAMHPSPAPDAPSAAAGAGEGAPLSDEAQGLASGLPAGAA